MERIKCKEVYRGLPSFLAIIAIATVYMVYAIYYNDFKLLNFRPKENSKLPERSVSQYLVVETSDDLLPSEKGLPVITNCEGGIGNQLFEFACAYAVAKKRNSDVYVKSSTLSPKGTHGSAGRTFSLDHFKIPFSRYTTGNFSKIFDLKEQQIWEKKIPANSVVRIRDVCVSEIYFKYIREEIKNMYQLSIDEKPIKAILDLLQTTDSVSVHVRRGDYGSKANNRTLPISYQKRAMKMMLKKVPNATFFIMSDDLPYTRKEFKLIQNVIYVDNSKQKLASLYDLLIMLRCKYNIIANSTFSWWAAYLNANKNKIVIAPYPRHPPGWDEWFYKDKKVYKYRLQIFNKHMYPTDWLTINPFVN